MIQSSNQPSSLPEKDKANTPGAVGPQADEQKKAEADKVKEQANSNTKS